MLKHIVTWKLKGDKETVAQNSLKIKEILEGLKTKIPEIQKIEVGINSSKAPEDNWDVVLISEFNSFEDLAKYQIHPAHKEIVPVIGAMKESRTCVDFEY